MADACLDLGTVHLCKYWLPLCFQPTVSKCATSESNNHCRGNAVTSALPPIVQKGSYLTLQLMWLAELYKETSGWSRKSIHLASRSTQLLSNTLVAETRYYEAGGCAAVRIHYVIVSWVRWIHFISWPWLLWPHLCYVSQGFPVGPENFMCISRNSFLGAKGSANFVLIDLVALLTVFFFFAISH